MTRSPQITLAVASIAVACGVLAFKWAAFHVTGSLALYSDALESIINVVTAVVALLALHLSSRPPDRHHQFGHHKAEYFAAVTEGVLIVLAAGLILREAAYALVSPRPMEVTGLGVAFSLVATAINAAWAFVLVTRGRRLRSPALIADGWHLAADVASSVAVVAGLIAIVVTGWNKLDALMALAVAFYILWAGGQLLRSSFSGLLDEAVEGEVFRRIREVIAGNGDGAIEAHDVRTRVAGRVTFIEFHLVVPGAMTVTQAHAICDRLEEALAASVPGAQVTIHVEPHGEARSTGAIVI